MKGKPLRVLMLTQDREDDLTDGLRHGLRRPPGVDLVDHPGKHCSNAGGIASRDRPGLTARGGGFNLDGSLPLDREPDRNQIFRTLDMGWFDLVVVGKMWRQWGHLIDWRALRATTPLALLDEADHARLYPGSKTHLRHFGPWRPRAASLLKPSGPRRFPTHSVDGELRDRAGGNAAYSFSSEAAHNRDLQSSRCGITTRRAGWDCLRHPELAAKGCELCFRDRNAKPASAAPHGLHSGNAIRATVRAAAALLGAFGWQPGSGG